MDRDDVGMAYAGEQACFRERLGTGRGGRRREQFERDVPRQAGVPGAKDHARRSPAEGLEQLERTPPLGDGSGSRRLRADGLQRGLVGAYHTVGASHRRDLTQRVEQSVGRAGGLAKR